MPGHLTAEFPAFERLHHGMVLPHPSQRDH